MQYIGNTYNLLKIQSTPQICHNQLFLNGSPLNMIDMSFDYPCCGWCTWNTLPVPWIVWSILWRLKNGISRENDVRHTDRPKSVKLFVLSWQNRVVMIASLKLNFLRVWGCSILRGSNDGRAAITIDSCLAAFLFGTVFNEVKRKLCGS